MPLNLSDHAAGVGDNPSGVNDDFVKTGPDPASSNSSGATSSYVETGVGQSNNSGADSYLIFAVLLTLMIIITVAIVVWIRHSDSKHLNNQG